MVYSFIYFMLIQQYKQNCQFLRFVYLLAMVLYFAIDHNSFDVFESLAWTHALHNLTITVFSNRMGHLPGTEAVFCSLPTSWPNCWCYNSHRLDRQVLCYKQCLWDFLRLLHFGHCALFMFLYVSISNVKTTCTPVYICISSELHTRLDRKTHLIVFMPWYSSQASICANV